MGFFLKVEIKERFNVDWTEFHEIEFYYKNNKINISELSIVDHNLTNPTYKVEYAIDGILNSGSSQNYVAMQSALPHYIVIKSNKEFDKVIFYDNNGKSSSNTYASKRLLFFSSDNGTDWDLIKEVINNVNANVNYTVEGIEFYKKRMIIKDPTTNNHYSLADSTLIHLPNTSTENIVSHGIKKGEEIHLNVLFNKHNYVNESTNGKVFTQEIGKTNVLKIKEVE